MCFFIFISQLEGLSSQLLKEGVVMSKLRFPFEAVTLVTFIMVTPCTGSFRGLSSFLHEVE